MAENVTTLFRPVGAKELELIRANGFRAFPPRQSSQPFFYPVLNEEYAIQIARDWNTKDEASGFKGYVLSFGVRTKCIQQYEVHVVGDSRHREYWIPAMELAEFNRNIVGGIRVVHEFPDRVSSGFFRPFGAFHRQRLFPWLAPWAAFFRRFAATNPRRPFVDY